MTSNRDKFFERLPKGGIVAEIGVREGENAARMLRILDPERLVLVDPMGDEIRRRYPQAFLAAMRLSAREPRISFFRCSSPWATRCFPDHYFDLVYIDGNHRYLPVMQDLFGWYPKIKPGGWLTGHDYADASPHAVQPAVDDFCKAHDLEVAFVVGEWTVEGPLCGREQQLPNFAVQVYDCELNTGVLEAAKAAAKMDADKSRTRGGAVAPGGK